MTGLTTEPQKAEAGPGDEVKMSKETQLKVEALRSELCHCTSCSPVRSSFVLELSQSAAPLILPVQGRAGGAAGQSPAGSRAVPAVVPVQHSCVRCPCVQHQWQVHPLPGRCQLQPHSGGADCHRQPATPGVPCLIPPFHHLNALKPY